MSASDNPRAVAAARREALELRADLVPRLTRAAGGALSAADRELIEAALRRCYYRGFEHGVAESCAVVRML